ncbi:MAG: S-layer homology domain-containing protein [Aminipila sp.]
MLRKKLAVFLVTAMVLTTTVPTAFAADTVVDNPPASISEAPATSQEAISAGGTVTSGEAISTGDNVTSGEAISTGQTSTTGGGVTSEGPATNQGGTISEGSTTSESAITSKEAIVAPILPVNESTEKITLEAKNLKGQVTDPKLWSMTSQKEIKVTVNFEKPVENVNKLTWSFGKDQESAKPLDQWSTYKGKNPLFEFVEAPVVDKADNSIVTATIRTGLYFNDLDGTAKRSNRGVFPGLIGDYVLKISNEFGEKQKEDAVTKVVWNIYDEYVMYDDMEDTVKDIIKTANDKGLYAYQETMGDSTNGEPTYCMVISDSEESVNNYLDLVKESHSNPEAIIDRINKNQLNDYRVPIIINNTHADENPGLDAQVAFLKKLAEAGAGGTIKYSSIDGFKDGYEAKIAKIQSKFAPEISKIATAIGHCEFMSKPYPDKDTEEIFVNTGLKEDIELFNNTYNVSQKEFKVDEILDNVIFVCNLTLNPDGRKANTRQNTFGFDPNRDNVFQVQQEARNMSALTAKWQPISFLDLHGFVREFLIEPCTPPHEPNLEYDLMYPYFLQGGQAFGNSAIAGVEKYTTYQMPVREYYDGKTWFYPWDDMATNYTPSYAMFQGCIAGYTIECPELNSDSVALFENGFYGISEFVKEHKKDMYLNQMEYFKRGVNNEESEATDSWFVDQNNNVVNNYRDKTNGKFYPEYWVIPTDIENQRNIASAYDLKKYFDLNGVVVKKLNADKTIDNVTYKAGSLVIDMHQAKRSLANMIMYNGKDVSNWSGLYSESVVAFPELRGFNATAIYKEKSFDGLLEETTESEVGKSVVNGATTKGIIIDNNGVAAVAAVNKLLNDSKEVKLVSQGDNQGDFLVSEPDFNTVKDKYILQAYGVDVIPTASAITKPKVYIVAEIEDDWSNASNEKFNHDYYAIKEQMGFNITKDVDQADIIVGSNALTWDENSTKVINKIKSGTPYIAMGAYPLEDVKANLLNSGFDYKTDDSSYESLFRVKYGDSIITKNYKEDKDFIAYSKSGSYITQVPKGAITLLTVSNDDNFHISGCYTDVRNSLKGKVEAISYDDSKIDVTVFANSITNKGHQQDDYRYLSTAIFAEASGINEVGDFSSDNPSNGGGSSKHGSSTTVSDKYTITVTAGKGGTISPSTASVAKGSNQSFDIKPDKGYAIEDVKVDGKSVGAVSSYKFTNVTSTHTIKATFKVSDGTPATTDTAIKVNFKDVNASNWFSSAVNYVMQKGIMKGLDNNTFGPNVRTNRAMIVTMLYRLEGQPSVGNSVFTDVDSSLWYGAPVTWANTNGVVTGYEGNKFMPNGDITREQLASILYRYAKYKKADMTVKGNLNNFSDHAQVASYAQEAVTWAVGTGIMTGKSGNLLDPKGSATRAEVAAMFQRLESLIK